MKLNELDKEIIYSVENESGNTLYATNDIGDLKNFFIETNYPLNNKIIKIFVKSTYAVMVYISFDSYFDKYIDKYMYDYENHDDIRLADKKDFELYKECIDIIIKSINKIKNIELGYDDWNIFRVDEIA